MGQPVKLIMKKGAIRKDGTSLIFLHRDLFVLGCLTGFRFSDYSTIKADEIRNGMLYVNQT